MIQKFDFYQIFIRKHIKTRKPALIPPSNFPFNSILPTKLCKLQSSHVADKIVKLPTQIAF